MRQLVVVVLILLTATHLSAQEQTPSTEIGLGYSYSYARVPNGTTRVNMNGLVIDGVFNINRWAGVQTEFGTHYHCISGCWIYGERVANPDETNDSLSFMIGPEVTLTRNRRVTPWIHALAGVTRTAYSNHLTDTKVSTSGFGWLAGGGVDLPFRPVSVRVLQIDFVRYAAKPEDFSNVRIGAGIVFRIGHKQSN